MNPQPALAGRRARAVAGLALGLAGLAGLTAGLRAWGPAGSAGLTNAALLYLVPVVVVAMLGGLWVGLTAALASDALLNWYFVPPYHTFVVERRENLVALLVYVVVAAAVAAAVDLAARQRAAAVRSSLQAQLLARIAGQPVVEDSLTRLLEHIRQTYGMNRVALLEHDPNSADPVDRVVAEVDDAEADGPRDGRDSGAGASEVASAPSLSVLASPSLRLVAQGPAIFAEDRQLLHRLAAAAARTLEAQRMAAQAAQAQQLAEVDRVRTAILAAVGHDLRTPLAGIKAAASSLRAPDVAFSPDDRAELLATIEECTDRLDELVENLLAMSRLQAGVLSVQTRLVALDEVVARAVLHLPGEAPLEIAVDDRLPLVQADPGLLERVVANLVSNAVAASTGRPVTIRGEPSDSCVALQIIDHGAGVPAGDRERMFAPFQRLDDRRADGGLGLGLAIARGFAEAMGAVVLPSDTAGGGLTMTVRLPVAAADDEPAKPVGAARPGADPPQAEAHVARPQSSPA